MIFWIFCYSILIVLWVYFFIYATRHGLKDPWGFGIVFIGLWLIDSEIAIPVNQSVFFLIHFPLIVCLIGLLINVNNIKEKFYIGDDKIVFRFMGLGLIFGLFLGLVMQIPTGVIDTQSNNQFPIFVVIAYYIQTSVTEEFLITGYFLGYLRKYGFGQILAVGIQALFFTFLHIPHFSGDWIKLLIVFLIGGMSGYFATKSNSLFPSFVFHIIINLVAIYW
jgi:membrane protease YdiL (CAAX protease family)